MKGDRAAFAVCALFLLQCARYAGLIELWGDEALSLDYAQRSWIYLLREQPFADALHLPTYLFFLKGAQALLGDGSLFALRLAFAVPFTIGLWFGYRAVRRLTSSPAVALATLVSGALIPSFVFYATSLRMYALLFLAAAWYLDRLSVVLMRPDGGARRDRILLACASAALVLADYPGVFLLAAGSVVRAVVAPRGTRLRTLLVSGAPATVLVVFAPPLIPAVRAILSAEHVRGGGAVGIPGGFDPFAWVKKGFVALRPILELTSPAQPSLLLAVVLPVVSAAFLATTAIWCLLVRRDRATVLLVVVAFHWLPAVPIGYSLPRAFLAALFVLPALFLLGGPRFPRLLAGANRVLFAGLLVTNLGLAIRPVIPFYSRLPVSQVTADLIGQAAARGLIRVAFSDNTANIRVIERSLEAEPRAAGLTLQRIRPGFEAADLPDADFLFVSHLAEGGNFVDPERFRELGYSVEPVAGYVELAGLPYNRLWLRQVLGRGSQPYLLRTYEIRSAPAPVDSAN